MVEISNNPNANDAFNSLFESTSMVIDNYIPLRKITNKEFKRRFKPWIYKGILISINRKNKLYSKYIKCKNNEIKILLFNEYKTLEKQINELILLGKKNHCANYFNENNNNLRKIWEGIKELVNIKPNNREPINCIVSNGKNLTDSKEISSVFNKYFSTIADDLLSKKKPHGGVAVFKNFQSNLKLNVIADNFVDCVVLEICNTQIIIVAPYIVPNNSSYFTDDYFSNLELILDHFKNRHIIVIGDMNSRIGPPATPFTYKVNPDSIINTNGKNLLSIINRHSEVFVINGIIRENIIYDSDFTYFRGMVASQNDLCLTNNIYIIKHFTILPKMTQSDHCPCLL